MENINTSIINTVIDFLENNEQYGDDWSIEIAELEKVVHLAVEAKRKAREQQKHSFIV